MTEDDLEAAVEQLARTFRWLAYHTRRSDRSPEGFPDLVMLRGGRLVVRELKIGRNQPTPKQREWLAAFEAAGVDVGVWTDDDWRDGTIEEHLRPTPRR